jgi:hypothetical protein
MNINELKADVILESKLIVGYKELLGIPSPLLSSDAQREVSEALAWSTSRLARLNAVIEACNNLAEHGYPSRDPQIVTSDVLAELKLSLQSFQLAVAEFETSLTVTSVVVES